MQEIFKFLQDAGVFYLATVDGNEPRVRPFGAVAEFEGRIYIVTNNTKPVFKQMKINPRIEISAMAGGKWLRLKATVALDDRREAKKAMLDANESLRNMYNEDDGLVEVLYLKEAEAEICSFTEAPVVYHF